jgi:plasmid stabilization system protein ParE
MAKRVIWSNKAKEEKLKILNYWADKTGSKKYSGKLEAKFRETIRHIAENNYLGKSTDIENIRVVIAGYYLLFYEIKAVSIEILTIFNTRRNPENVNLENP